MTTKLPRWYRKWSSMIQRCYNPKHERFKYYGGRGITVCDRWMGQGGSKNFLADMGEPPEGMTLDRVENNLGYSKENCRWATWKQQAENRRPGGPKNDNSLRQRAVRAGLAPMVVYLRVRSGWPVEMALSEPVRKKTDKKLFVSRV